MKYVKKYLLFFILICIVLINISFAKEMVVLLDPGHGGSDAGATNGIYKESFYNFDLCQRVAKGLEQKGVKVFLTRNSDVYASLSARYEMAHNLKADLFISIHNNAAEAKSAKGTEVLYYSANDSQNGIRNMEIARIIRDGLVNDTGLIKRNIVERPNLAILKGARSIPCVLIEVAFISNADDLALLNSVNFREKAATSITNSITTVLGKLGDFSVSSGATQVSKCGTCGSALESKYYSTGTGQHYRECTNKIVKVGNEKKGHHTIENHEFNKDGKCVCGAYLCKLKNSDGKECGGIVENTYRIDKVNAVHYKFCIKNPINHHFNVSGHTFLMGKCICGETQSGVQGGETNLVGHNNPLFSNIFAWAEKEIATMNKKGIEMEWDNNKELTVKEFNEGLAKVLKEKNINMIVEKHGLKDGDKITREQAAYIMGAYVDGIATSENLLGATDWSKVNSAYKQRINKLVNKNIFRGKENHSKIVADPQGKVTGAEGKVLLVRLYDVL